MRCVTASARADTSKNVPKHLRLPCIDSTIVALGRESRHPLLQGRSISSRHVPAGNMTRETALLLFNSVRANVSTICRIGFACTQGRIKTE
jgi:hypothetical protein